MKDWTFEMRISHKILQREWLYIIKSPTDRDSRAILRTKMQNPGIVGIALPSSVGTVKTRKPIHRWGDAKRYVNHPRATVVASNVLAITRSGKVYAPPRI